MTDKADGNGELFGKLGSEHLLNDDDRKILDSMSSNSFDNTGISKDYKAALQKIIDQRKIEGPITPKMMSGVYEDSLVTFTPQKREEILKTAQRLFDKDK